MCDGGVREAAAELMGSLREAATAHVAALQARMHDGDEAVRDAAVDALARLGYYNPVTGSVKSRGFYRTQKPRARGPRLGPDGKPVPRRPASSLSRRVMVEVGATIRVWWPDDACFYEARVKAWDRETDVHTLLYVEDGVEEDLDLKKVRQREKERGCGGGADRGVYHGPACGPVCGPVWAIGPLVNDNAVGEVAVTQTQSSLGA